MHPNRHAYDETNSFSGSPLLRVILISLSFISFLCLSISAGLARVSGSCTGESAQGFQDDDLLKRAVPTAAPLLILGIGEVKHSFIVAVGTSRRYCSPMDLSEGGWRTGC